MGSQVRPPTPLLSIPPSSPLASQPLCTPVDQPVVPSPSPPSPPRTIKRRRINCPPPTSDTFAPTRDLPDMSQDTLALFPTVVRQQHAHPADPHSHALATASVLSTLANSEALHNPFMHKADTPTTRRGESYKAQQERLLKLLLVSSSQGRSMAIDFVYRGVCGVGAFSEVHKVSHRLDGSFYAIKKNKQAMFTNEARRDALHEVFVLASLQSHPNIIRYLDAWFEQRGLFLLIQTEFLESGNLYTRYVEKNMPMSAEQLFFLASDIASALKHVHAKNIVHLDVKPDNIFQRKTGSYRDPFVLADFGLACHSDGYDAKTTEGDSRYLAPEALIGNLQKERFQSSDSMTAPFSDLRAADMFSLGVTLYELAMGVPLRKGSGAATNRDKFEKMALEVREKCGSEILQSIVLRCLEPDPSKRASASDLAAFCSRVGSLEEDEEKRELRRQHAEMERKVGQYKQFLGSIIKMGEAGREAYRKTSRKRHCSFS